METNTKPSILAMPCLYKNNTSAWWPLIISPPFLIFSMHYYNTILLATSISFALFAAGTVSASALPQNPQCGQSACRTLLDCCGALG